MLLHNTEFVFKLENESRLPISFEEASRIESKSLVEEYMLLANIKVAEFLSKYCKEKTLLRAHADIPADKKTELKQFLTTIGLNEQIDP